MSLSPMQMHRCPMDSLIRSVPTNGYLLKHIMGIPAGRRLDRGERRMLRRYCAYVERLEYEEGRLYAFATVGGNELEMKVGFEI